MLDVSITHSILIQINILCLTFVRISLKSLSLLGATTFVRNIAGKVKKEKLRIKCNKFRT